MKHFFIILLFNLIAPIFSQEQDSLLIGKKYFEDQLYIGVSSNTFFNKPNDFKQHGVSTGFQAGFIKDIPINKKGNLAFGIGIGYEFNKYKQNLKIPDYTFEDIILPQESNHFTTHAIVFPISFRYRTSTSRIHPYYRVYAGARLIYAYSSLSKYISEDENIEVKNISSLNKWQYGPQLTVGYGNVNLYVSMVLSDIFKQPEDVDIDVSQLREYRLGLQFYIF